LSAISPPLATKFDRNHPIGKPNRGVVSVVAPELPSRPEHPLARSAPIRARPKGGSSARTRPCRTGWQGIAAGRGAHPGRTQTPCCRLSSPTTTRALPSCRRLKRVCRPLRADDDLEDTLALEGPPGPPRSSQASAAEVAVVGAAFLLAVPQRIPMIGAGLKASITRKRKEAARRAARTRAGQRFPSGLL
jgi:hypothetical protein